MRSIKLGLRLLTLVVCSLPLTLSTPAAATSGVQPLPKAGATTAQPTSSAVTKSVAQSVVQPAAKSAATSTAKSKIAGKPAANKSRKKKPSNGSSGGSINTDLKSASLLVIDAGDESILLAKNADKPAPIASITKLMTALVVLDAEQSLDEKIEITREDRAIDKGGPSRLAAGTVLSRGDLLHLALMSSENRAAYAVGRSYPGGIDELLRAMNQKAKALGMANAHFVDPTGLSSKNVASPADLSKLVIAASRNSTIRSYSTDPEHEVQVGSGKHKSRMEFRNTNNLVRKKDWDIVVQKTGYTEAAGRCLVMKTVVKDRPVVIVLLNSFGKYTRVADAARIRRWIETSDPQTLARSAMATAPALHLSR